MIPAVNQFTASLWGDEAFSAILSMKTIPQIVSIISRDTSPPLYNLTEHFVFRMFGTSEVVIRGLSFFYYLLAVFFIYKIGALVWDRKTGIYAALLTFFNPFFFTYAFEGRMYSLMALGVCASMYFLLKKKWKLYVLATLVALYSHHFAIFSLGIQGLWFLYLLAKDRKAAWRMFLSLVAIFILYLPWLPILYSQTKMVAGGFWLGKPTNEDLKKLIYQYLAKGDDSSLAQNGLYLVWALLLFRKWNKKIIQSLFLVMWFFVPVLATWIISQKISSIFYNRYLLYSIPAATIGLASNGRKFIQPILIGILLAIFVTIDWGYFIHPTKLPFREFSEAVKEVKKGDDYLVNWNASGHKLWETKYYGVPAPIYIEGDNGQLPFYVGTALMEKTDIIHSLPKSGFNRIGVITSGSVDDVNIPNYTKSDVIKVSDLKLIWFNK